MRPSLALLVVTLSALAACGGGGGGAAAPAAGSGSAAGGGAPSSRSAPAADNGVPRWVGRGGGAVVGAGGRAFYGVGNAEGIRNPALLRSTADDRARNDLAKVFETYSASLMKDYAASNGEQAVEQAVKTLTSMSLKGVEIVDHYIAGDGSLYSLARLDLESVAGVLRGEAMGAAKSYTTKVDPNDMFDRNAKKDDPPPPPPPAAASAPSDKAAPPSASSGAATAKAKPAWVDGADPRFPARELLCAVGFGPERAAGENAAYAAVSRIFEARVQSVSKDFMGAYSKTGAESVEVQSAEQLTEVATSGILSGVEIKEIWQDGATTYALACLERAKAGRILQEKIALTDAAAGKQLESAVRLDKASKVRALGKALDSLVERASLNGELRIVHPDGIGVPSEYSHVDVAAAFEAAMEALKVGVVATGPYDGDFRGALISGLTSRGFKVTDGAADGMDVLVTATIRIEDGGKGTGSMASVSFARAVIRVEIKNVAQNKILDSIEESKKDGSRSKEEAERRVVRALAKKLSDKVGFKIEKAMLQ